MCFRLPMHIVVLFVFVIVHIVTKDILFKQEGGDLLRAFHRRDCASTNEFVVRSIAVAKTCRVNIIKYNKYNKKDKSAKGNNSKIFKRCFIYINIILSLYNNYD